MAEPSIRARGTAGCRRPRRLHRLVGPAGGHASDPVDPLRGSTLDHGDQGLLGRPAVDSGAVDRWKGGK